MIPVAMERTSTIGLTEREVRTAALLWLDRLIGDYGIRDGRIVEYAEHPHNGSDLTLDRASTDDPKYAHVVYAIELRAAMRARCVDLREHQLPKPEQPYAQKCTKCGDWVR